MLFWINQFDSKSIVIFISLRDRVNYSYIMYFIVKKFALNFFSKKGIQTMMFWINRFDPKTDVISVSPRDLIAEHFYNLIGLM